MAETSNQFSASFWVGTKYGQQESFLEFGVIPAVENKKLNWEVCFPPFLIHEVEFGILPSLKLTEPLKMDGWKTHFLLGPGPFSGGLAVSFREGMRSLFAKM